MYFVTRTSHNAVDMITFNFMKLILTTLSDLTQIATSLDSLFLGGLLSEKAEITRAESCYSDSNFTG